MQHRSGAWRIDWLILLTLLTASLAAFSGAGWGAQTPAGAATAGSAPTGALSQATANAHSGIAGWTPVGSYDENTLTAGEGVTTLFESPHRSSVLYRGIESVPSNLKAQGWGHIGDPDSIRGYVFDAFQGPSSGNSKMFLVTTPSGKSLEYVHTLVRGEEYNNSFAAISPDTQWMVAGEWNTMNHLQIYPTPLLDHRTPRHGGALDLAGFIRLDHKVNDVQGCDFVNPVRLICASDDDSRTLFPNEKPLLEVDLAKSLHGTSVKGHVVDLGSIPQVSSCSGTFEAEGVDFDTSTHVLRVEVIQPGSCILKTTIYEYEPARGRG